MATDKTWLSRTTDSKNSVVVCMAAAAACNINFYEEFYGMAFN